VQEDVDAFCYDDLGTYTCSALELCCEDADADGVYDSCGLLADEGELVDDGLGGSVLECPLGTELVSAQCQSYENEWVFNISDFVGYLWNLDSTGAYNIQVRFYPLTD